MAWLIRERDEISTLIFTWFLQDRYRSMDARQRRGPEPAPEPVDKWFGILAFNPFNHSKRPEWCVSWQGGWSRISRIACIFLIFPHLVGSTQFGSIQRTGKHLVWWLRKQRWDPVACLGIWNTVAGWEGTVRRLLEGRVTVLNWDASGLTMSCPGTVYNSIL